MKLLKKTHSLNILLRALIKSIRSNPNDFAYSPYNIFTDLNSICPFLRALSKISHITALVIYNIKLRVVTERVWPALELKLIHQASCQPRSSPEDRGWRSHNQQAQDPPLKE